MYNPDDIIRRLHRTGDASSKTPASCKLLEIRRVSRNSKIYEIHANAGSIYDAAKHLRLVIVRRTRLPSRKAKRREKQETSRAQEAKREKKNEMKWKRAASWCPL